MPFSVTNSTLYFPNVVPFVKSIRTILNQVGNTDAIAILEVFFITNNNEYDYKMGNLNGQNNFIQCNCLFDVSLSTESINLSDMHTGYDEDNDDCLEHTHSTYIGCLFNKRGTIFLCIVYKTWGN